MGSNRVLSVLGILLLISIGAASQASSDSAQTGSLTTGVTVTDSPGQVFSSSKTQSASFASLASLDAEALPRTEPMPVAPAIIATPMPVKKTESADKDYARNKKIWFSLMAIEHGAAGFDAWSTRQAVGRGAKELNPLMKPFANSAAMYPAAQVVPFGMDFLARKMMRSNNRTLRKLWWLPQTASTVASLAAGIHNMGVNSAR